MSNLAGKPPLGLKQPKAKKNPAYLARVAKLACVICGARPVHVHHVISGRYSQRKAPDEDTISLCHFHHLGQGGIHTNKAAWEDQHGPDTSYLHVVARMLADQP